MSVSQGTFQQTRELLKHSRLNREQVEALARNGGLCGELPDPSGYADGQPYWTRQSIVDWSETTKRSRGNPVGGSQRSMVATLLGRERKKQASRMQSEGELAKAIAFDEISIDEAESRCDELGISAAVLSTTVSKIQDRQRLVAQLERGEEAQSEIVRLEAEIALVDAEAEEFMSGIQDRQAKLGKEQQAARGVARAADYAQRQLRETIPDWLIEKIDATRAEANGPQQKADYQRSQLRRMSIALETSRGDLTGVDRQLQSLLVQESDFEGLKRQEALLDKQSRLSAQVKSLEAEQLQVEQAMWDETDRTGPAIKRLKKLESKIFEVWPDPADV